jgi:hypothetical protein
MKKGGWMGPSESEQRLDSLTTSDQTQQQLNAAE